MAEQKQSADLVAQMRSAAECIRRAGKSGSVGHLAGYEHLTILDAIDRIASLEAEVERRKYDGIHTCHDQCQRIACVLRRENERLRGLIWVMIPQMEAAFANPDALKDSAFAIDAFGASIAIARAAIKEQPHG